MDIVEIEQRPGGNPQRRERGAIVVEATLSLSFFMFMMFIMLSLTQIAYAQARMSVALACATKEVAEYSHIYYITGLNESLSGTGGKSSELFGELGDFLKEVGGDVGSIDEELGQFITDGGNASAATSITTIAKNLAGSGIVMKLMEANMGDGTPEGAERFKRRYRIENINMLESDVLSDKNHIAFRIRYDIRVVRLLGMDYVFHMSTWAYANAWSGK